VRGIRFGIKSKIPEEPEFFRNFFCHLPFSKEDEDLDTNSGNSNTCRREIVSTHPYLARKTLAICDHAFSLGLENS
jgi:hypothetical protein